MFYARNGFKKQLILKKRTILKFAKNGNHAKAIAHAKYSKNKIAKHITKNVSTTHSSCFMQNTARKNS